MSMKNVGGVFIVLCSGVGVAAILASMEMFWTLWKTTTKEKVRMYNNTVSNSTELNFGHKLCCITRRIYKYVIL